MLTPIDWLNKKEAEMRSWEQEKPEREKAAYYRTFSACFCLVALVLLFAFLSNGREPIWNIDGLEQYLPFYIYEGEWIRSVVAGLFTGNMPDSFLWSWNLGYGADTIATLDVFLDPLNLSSALLPAAFAEYMFVLMVFVRMYLAGIFFSAYALYRKHGRFSVLCGSLVYCFSGPALAATFWPGGTVPLVLFPLLLLGAEKIFAREKPTTFIVAVALFLIVTYYFSFSAFIFLFAYCAIRVFQIEKNVTAGIFLKWTGKFFAFLMVGAAISAIVLLPGVIKILSNDRATSAIADIPLLYGLNYYGRIPGSLIAPTNIGSDCYIGFGGGAFVALVGLFSKRKANTVLKVVFVAMCIFILIPAFGSFFNGMNYATNRWAWAFAMCIGYIVVCTLPLLEKAKPHLRGLLVGATAVYGLIILLVSGSRTETVLASFVGLMCVVAAVLATPSMRSKVARYAICTAFVVSVGINAAYFGNAQESPYANTSVPIGQGYKKLTDDSPNSAVATVNDSSYWRYDADTSTEGAYGSAWTRVSNSSLTLGLSGIDFYNSIYNDSIDELHTELGVADDCINFRFYDLDSRCALETLMGVKYYLAPEANNVNLPYNYTTPVAQKAARGMNDVVYTANNYLPIGFTYDKTITRSEYLSLSQVERQEAMLSCMVVDDDTNSDVDSVNAASLDLGTKQVQADVTSTNGLTIEDGVINAAHAGASMTLTVQGMPNSETYLVFKNLGFKNVSPRDGVKKKDFDKMSWYRKAYLVSQSIGYTGVTNYMITAEGDKGGSYRTITNFVPSYHMYGGKSDWSLNLGYSTDPQQTITITFRDGGIYSFDDLSVVCEPMDNFDQKVDSLKQDVLNDMQIGCDSLSGNIDVAENKYLYLSIPYSSGWSATVDGEPVDIVKANTAFMAIPLSAGHHEIELHYMTPGLTIGAAITLFGIIAFAAIVFYYRRKHSSSLEATGKTER